jgi:hypothetical protein
MATLDEYDYIDRNILGFIEWGPRENFLADVVSDKAILFRPFSL